MKLFHYTTNEGAWGIYTDGHILQSTYNPLINGRVSLTTDTDSSGHGLPDGREITKEQALNIAHKVVGTHLYCHDHTAWRITLDLDENDPNLKSAKECHDEKLIVMLDLAGWNPVDAHPSHQLIVTTAQKFLSGKMKPKSSTWRYYNQQLPVSRDAVFEVRNLGGQYTVSVPQDPKGP